MNVYDFDDTIYAGDSTQDFFRFLYKRYSWRLMAAFPAQIKGFLLYLCGFCDKTEMKSAMYTVFKHIDDIDEEVRLFWETHRKNIKPFYEKMHLPNDVVISASPFFLLKPIAEELGIYNLIASDIDPQTGLCDGLNCHGEEKIRRLECAGHLLADIECFYSDSLADTPLAKLAKEAFMVKGLEIAPWEAPDEGLLISNNAHKLALISSPAVVLFLIMVSFLGLPFAFLSLTIAYIFLWRFYDRLTTRPLTKTPRDILRFAMSFLPFFLLPLVGMKSNKRKSIGLILGYSAAFLAQKCMQRVSKQ